LPVIVSDTTRLNYLILIDAADLLPQLYERVLAPGAVWNELSHPRTTEKARNWLSRKPEWLEIVSVKPSEAAGLAHPDPGERDAIDLAPQFSAPRAAGSI
jgi:predicted nucleic acid-binding protein